MTTLGDARTAWKESTQRQFKTNSPTRTLYLGRGTGLNSEDMYVSGSPNYFYARPSLSNSNWVIVKNTGGIGAPVFNLPVLAGFSDTDKKEEQILGIDHGALTWQYNTSSLGGNAGAHAAQHGINGADPLFIDPRVFIPGLPKPIYDAPSGSLQVYVAPVAYMYDKLYMFSGASTGNLYDYLPPTGAIRYITLALDARSGTLVVRPGAVQFPPTGGAPTDPADWLDFDFNTPSGTGVLLSPQDPGGEEIPLAAIYLTSETDYLEWRDDTPNAKNMFDIRPLLSPPVGKLVNFMDERDTNGTLSHTGAEEYRSEVIDGNIVDSNLYLGFDNPIDYGYGKKVVFRGVRGSTDEVWIAKYTPTYNSSFIRFHVSDDEIGEDAVQFGTSSKGSDKLFLPYFQAFTDGRFIFGQPPTSHIGLNVEGDVTITGNFTQGGDTINHITSPVNVELAPETRINLVNTTASIILTMPAASDIDTSVLVAYVVKNHFNSTSIDIAPNTLDVGFTIEGDNSITLYPGDAVKVFTDGSDWHII